MTITLNGTTGIASTGAYSSDGISFADNTPANTLVTDTSGNVGIGTSSPATKLDVNGSVRLPDGYEVGFGSANTTFWLGDSTNNWHRFYTSNTERMRIDSSGNLLVGTTSAIGKLGVSGSGAIATFNQTAVGNYCITTNPFNNAGIYYHNAFNIGGSGVGSITSSGSSTTFATSSDYRLKENIAPITSALVKVQALKPCTYTWKSTNKQGEGFIAHELAEVCPDAVVGQKDAVDAEGNPQYQGIDTSFLVATLTAAIQEQQAIITDLKARIETLENK